MSNSSGTLDLSDAGRSLVNRCLCILGALARRGVETGDFESVHGLLAEAGGRGNGCWYIGELGRKINFFFFYYF